MLVTQGIQISEHSATNENQFDLQTAKPKVVNSGPWYSRMRKVTKMIAALFDKQQSNILITEQMQNLKSHQLSITIPSTDNILY